MESYKNLNAQLIVEIQKMRQQIAEYNKEIVRLRALVIEEHENYVAEKVANEERLVKLCSYLHQSIDNIMANGMKNENKTYRETASSGVTIGGSNNIGKIHRRHSKIEILDELRQSYAVTRNSITISPLRQRSGSNSSSETASDIRQNALSSPCLEETEYEEGIVNSTIKSTAQIDNAIANNETVSEIQETDVANGIHNMSLDENENAEESEISEAENQSSNLFCIEEENFDSDTSNTMATTATESTITTSTDSDDTDVYDLITPVKQQNMQQHQQHHYATRQNERATPIVLVAECITSPLRDVTNLSINKTVTSSPNAVKKPVKKKKTVNPEQQQDAQQSIQMMRQLDKSVRMSNMNATHSAHLRITAATPAMTPIKLPETVDKSATFISTSFTRLSMSNFNAVPTSTPNSQKICRHSTIKKENTTNFYAETSNQIQFQDIENNGNGSLRPRRGCRPKSLKEPKLNTKMRRN